MSLRPFPIVATKLAAPKASGASVRPDTMALIRRGASLRLLLVQAPAGYGKTTVIGEAARRLEWRAAWYKLDMLDQDPMVFVASLAESIRRVVPGFGAIITDRLADLHDAPLSTAELLGILAAELNDEVSGPLHIILDDYHESSNSAPLNSAIDYLLTTAPHNVRFVLLTRFEPALQLSRLLLAGEVTTVGREDLRFSREQAATLLQQRGICEQDLAGLDYVLQMTEGWPASLVLIGNALAGDRAIAESLLADPLLKGDLYTYLAEQVYSTQDSAVQRFLRMSAALDYMTPRLAAEVAETDSAERHLLHLTTKCLFTFRTEEGNYRYHHLFRAFLKHKALQEDGTEAFRAAQLRAAAALERSGDFAGATEHLLGLGRFEDGLRCAAGGAEEAIETYQSETIEGWLQRLPLPLFTGNPNALLLRAQLLLRSARHDESLAWAQQALKAFVTAGDQNGQYRALTAMESTLYWRGDYLGAIDCCRQALSLNLAPAHRAHSLASLASASIHLADWRQVDQALDEAEAQTASVDSVETIRAACFRTHSLLAQGRLREARLRARTALPSVREHRHDSLHIGFLNLVSAIDLLSGDYPAARRSIDSCLKLCADRRYGHMQPFFDEVLGQILVATGSMSDGMELIRAALTTEAVAADSHSAALCLCHLGTASRRAGQLDDAIRYYERACDVSGRQPSAGLSVLLDCNLAFARGLGGDRAQTGELLSAATRARAHGLVGLHSRCLAFAGLLFLREQDWDAADSYLQSGLRSQIGLGGLHFVCQELAQLPVTALGFVLLRSDPELTMALLSALCRYHASGSILSTLIDAEPKLAIPCLQAAHLHLPSATWRALAKRNTHHRTSAVRKFAHSLLQPFAEASKANGFPELTAREIEVLGMIAAGRRNEEIAADLFLSVATVKTYVNRIFSKLGAGNRVSAALLYRARLESPARPDAKEGPRERRYPPQG